MLAYTVYTWHFGLYTDRYVLMYVVVCTCTSVVSVAACRCVPSVLSCSLHYSCSCCGEYVTGIKCLLPVLVLVGPVRSLSSMFYSDKLRSLVRHHHSYFDMCFIRCLMSICILWFACHGRRSTLLTKKYIGVYQILYSHTCYYRPYGTFSNHETTFDLELVDIVHDCVVWPFDFVALLIYCTSVPVSQCTVNADNWYAVSVWCVMWVL